MEEKLYGRYSPSILREAANREKEDRPLRAGDPWGERELEDLSKFFGRGESASSIARKLARPLLGVILKLEKLGYVKTVSKITEGYRLTELGYDAVMNGSDQESWQMPPKDFLHEQKQLVKQGDTAKIEKEPEMKEASVVIEQRVFINGKPAESYSDDDLIDMLQGLKVRAEKLTVIKDAAKVSAFLKENLQKVEEETENLLKYMDTRATVAVVVETTEPKAAE